MPKKKAQVKTEPEKPEAPAVETVALDQVASDLEATSSVPSESFVEAREQKAVEEKSEYAGLRDKLGYTFDPAIHMTDAEGKPKFNADNTLKRRRIRKKKSATSDAVSKAAAVQLTADQQQQARFAGIAAANSMLVVCRGLGGEDWAPQKDDVKGIDERAELSQAFGDYFVSKGWTEFPPGVALALCVSMYAAPRFTLPATQNRVKSGWLKMSAWFEKRKRKNGAQSDIGNDGKREVNAGKNAGGNGSQTRSKSDRPGPHA